MNYLNWRRADILVSTPTQLATLLEMQPGDIGQTLRPRFVVLDEFDQMLTDKKYLTCLTAVLRGLGSTATKGGRGMTEDNVDRKVDYLLSSSYSLEQA